MYGMKTTLDRFKHQELPVVQPQQPVDERAEIAATFSRVTGNGFVNMSEAVPRGGQIVNYELAMPAHTVDLQQSKSRGTLSELPRENELMYGHVMVGEGKHITWTTGKHRSGKNTNGVSYLMGHVERQMTASEMGNRHPGSKLNELWLNGDGRRAMVHMRAKSGHVWQTGDKHILCGAFASKRVTEEAIAQTLAFEESITVEAYLVVSEVTNDDGLVISQLKANYKRDKKVENRLGDLVQQLGSEMEEDSVKGGKFVCSCYMVTVLRAASGHGQILSSVPVGEYRLESVCTIIGQPSKWGKWTLPKDFVQAHQMGLEIPEVAFGPDPEKFLTRFPEESEVAMATLEGQEQSSRIKSFLKGTAKAIPSNNNFSWRLGDAKLAATTGEAKMHFRRLNTFELYSRQAETARDIGVLKLIIENSGDQINKLRQMGTTQVDGPVMSVTIEYNCMIAHEMTKLVMLLHDIFEVAIWSYLVNHDASSLDQKGMTPQAFITEKQVATLPQSFCELITLGIRGAYLASEVGDITIFDEFMSAVVRRKSASKKLEDQEDAHVFVAIYSSSEQNFKDRIARMILAGVFILTGGCVGTMAAIMSMVDKDMSMIQVAASGANNPAGLTRLAARHGVNQRTMFGLVSHNAQWAVAERLLLT